MDDFYFEDHAEVPEADFETKVPADFRFAFKKGDGGVYKLDDSYAAAAKLIDGRGKTLKQTKATNQSVGNESRQRREALEKWAAETGFATPEEAKAAIEDLTKKVTDKSQIKPEEIRAAVAKEYDTKLEAEKGEKDAMFGTLEKVLRDNAALQAIGEHKGNAKLLMPLILGKTKVVKDEETGEYVTVVLNDKGEVRAGSDGQRLPISKLVEEMKADKDLAMAFEGTKQNGGGTPPGQQRQQQQQNNGGGQQQQQQNNGGKRGLANIQAGLAARS